MSSTSPISVAIVHPDPLVCGCLAGALASAQDIDVIMVVTEPDQLWPMKERASVIVAEYNCGVVLAADSPNGEPDVPIIIVSGADREWEVRTALANGVKGYLVPSFELEHLGDGCRAVTHGSRFMCTRSAARLTESLSFETLTERETEVLEQVVRGLPNKMISRQMKISIGTVKSHIKSAYGKMRVSSRSLAVAEARRRGFLRPELETETRSYHFPRDDQLTWSMARTDRVHSRLIEQARLP